MQRSSITIALLLFACSGTTETEPPEGESGSGGEDSSTGGTGGATTAGTGSTTGGAGSTTGGTGSTTGGTGGSSGQSTDAWPAADGCAAVANGPLVGVWEGAIEDLSFDPVIPLRIELRGASETEGVCGTVLWGEGDPPPPVTDPNLGYPTDTGYGKAGPSYVGFYEGATYTIVDGGVRNDQLRLVLSGNELWREWCSLQEPIGSSEYGYGCMPPNNSGMYDYDTNLCQVTDSDTGEIYDFSIDKCNLCQDFTCACTATACDANRDLSQMAIFDLVVDGDEATGTVEGPVEFTDVHLVRVD